jgi:hypothetical protein
MCDYQTLFDMELYLPTIITAILIFLGGLWLKNFLPNYFNEKGKLLAQKEDIQEITEKIEGVKSEFTKETEFLKVELQKLLNFEVSHRTEERNSIINFYERYNQWLYALLEINFGVYSNVNFGELVEKRIYIEKFYAETSVAQSKLKLLVKDNDIIILSGDLMLEILKFKGWIDKRLLSLQHNLESHKSLTDQFLVIIKDFEQNKEVAKSMAEEEKEIKAKRKEIVDEFYANRNDEYGKILTPDSDFRELVKAYLTR